jgi:hypothetical protein
MTLYAVPIGLTPKGPIDGLGRPHGVSAVIPQGSCAEETLKRLENPLPPM